MFGHMRLPRVRGVIRRRILVNFRVAPDAIERVLPPPFRPKLLGDVAIAGICLIRLEHIRPGLLPAPVGLDSENAAHRIAVCWDDASAGTPDGTREGVYIPRRDSDSYLNHLVGGRLFPGVHHRAVFDVQDTPERISLTMRSTDGDTRVEVRGKPAAALPETSRFASLADASAFFERGSLGYSATAEPTRFDGLTLVTKTWRVEPLEVEHVFSSFFSDTTVFPPGSVELDCALLMRDIDHEWVQAPDMRAPASVSATT